MRSPRSALLAFALLAGASFVAAAPAGSPDPAGPSDPAGPLAPGAYPLLLLQAAEEGPFGLFAFVPPPFPADAFDPLLSGASKVEVLLRQLDGTELALGAAKDSDGRWTAFPFVFDGAVHQASAAWRDGRLERLSLKPVGEGGGTGAGESATIVEFSYDGPYFRAATTADGASTVFVFSSLPRDSASGEVLQTAYGEDGGIVSVVLYRYVQGLLRSVAVAAEDGSLAETLRLDYDASPGAAAARTPSGNAELSRDAAGRIAGSRSAGADGGIVAASVQRDGLGRPLREVLSIPGGARSELRHEYDRVGEWRKRTTIVFVERFGALAPAAGPTAIRSTAR